MKSSFVFLSAIVVVAFLFLCLTIPAAAQGSVIVRGQFGGFIFGFDIDPNGNEGLLAEAVINPDGTVHAAVETFDQQTGAIIKVITESNSFDDFIVRGIVGNSVGLVEREHVISTFNVQRTFVTINPLNANQLTAPWTPPIDKGHIVTQVRRASGNSTDVAVLATDVSGGSIPLLFTSDVATNTFSPVFSILDRDFNFGEDPAVALDGNTHQVFLGHETNSQFIVAPKIATVDVTQNLFHKLIGRGRGLINGIAVDSEDRVLFTTTSFIPEVEFYDLTTLTGRRKLLPGAGAFDGLNRGQAVEYDPLNKLFLIAQPFTSTGTSGSSIQVYDFQGNFVESIDGLSFNGTANVFPVHIALNPGLRLGYVDGPNTNGTEIQSFTY